MVIEWPTSVPRPDWVMDVTLAVDLTVAVAGAVRATGRGHACRRQVREGRSVEPRVEQVGEVLSGRQLRELDEGPVLTVPWACLSVQPRSRCEEGVVADREAQGVQGQRAALVDAVVEHQLRARVGEHEVLVEAVEPGVVLLGARRGPTARPDSSDQIHSA